MRPEPNPNPPQPPSTPLNHKETTIVFKTILTIAVAASAYLITGDARAQDVDMQEPTAICSDAGNCFIVSPPNTWAWDSNEFIHFRVGTAQEAVACATPQVKQTWNGRQWVRMFVAKGTVGRAINDHVCNTVARLVRAANRPAMY